MYERMDVAFSSFCQLKKCPYLCVKNQRNAKTIFQHNPF